MNTIKSEELFYPYVSHDKIELIESKHSNTYRHLLRLLTPHPHVYDCMAIDNALHDKVYSIFTLDNLNVNTFPILAILPNKQIIKNNFLIYTHSLSKYSKGWIKGLTKEQCIKACSGIQYVDLSGINRGPDFITQNLHTSKS